VIVHLAKLAASCKRDADVLGRIGGEEFALLLPDTDPAQAEVFAERLRNEVSTRPINVGAEAVCATVSIGVAERNWQTVNVSEMLNAADKALYAAKHAGRNRVARIATKAVPKAATRISPAA
jgi:diguanylate cyclase (GGDEF)-like protein